MKRVNARKHDAKQVRNAKHEKRNRAQAKKAKLRRYISRQEAIVERRNRKAHNPLSASFRALASGGAGMTPGGKAADLAQQMAALRQKG